MEIEVETLDAAITKNKHKNKMIAIIAIIIALFIYIIYIAYQFGYTSGHSHGAYNKEQQIKQNPNLYNLTQDTDTHLKGTE